MKKLILLSAILFFVLSSYARENYWQNEVSYEIHVTLNDTSHSLDAWQITTFKNNSPDILDEIYFLLMPNAYKDTTSAFARQQKKFYRSKFLLSKPDQRGWIEVDSITANGQSVDLIFDLGSPDLARVKLSKSLNPGETIEFYLHWRMKYPDEFSRMNHDGQHYETTQWYPKIAVYDDQGWHPYPYLDAGEFYGEFGTYDVFITLPKNYVVAATGDLMTEEEIAWRDSLAKVGNEFFQKTKKERKRLVKKWKKDKDRYKSSKELKTVHFHQEKVHDFAWFADKRYIVQKGIYYYPDSSFSVDLWTYCIPKHHEAWEKSIEYAHDALEYYGKWYGQYPYRQVSAVDGAFSAGGGMEYPNITVCQSTNMQPVMAMLIVHEIGHNWFYGILGTDERKSAWMDEGMNSYSESRYFREKYGINNQFITLPGPLNYLTHSLHHKVTQFLPYKGQVFNKWDLPATLASEEYPTASLYGSSVYAKTALIFRGLHDYLGEKRFNRAMQAYYEKWKFKHPRLEDFREVMENSCGEDLSWFFDDFLQASKQIDYEIKKVQIESNGSEYTSQIEVVNNGECNAPFFITTWAGNDSLKGEWTKPDGKRTLVTMTTKAKPTQFIIDPNMSFPEITHINNTYKLRFRVAPLFEMDYGKDFLIVLSPYLWHDHMDGLGLGIRGFRGFTSPMTHNFGATLGYGFLSQRPFWSMQYKNLKTLSKSSRYVWETDIDDRIGKQMLYSQFNLEFYSPYKAKRFTNTLSVSFDWIDLYDENMFDPLYWDAGEKYSNFSLNLSRSDQSFNWSYFTNFSYRQGISPKPFSAFTFRTTVSYRFSNKLRKLRLKTRLFLGTIGEQAPKQERFYASTSIDPLFRNKFVFDRTGKSILTPNRNYFVEGGPMLIGYNHLMHATEAAVLNLELSYSNITIFASVGDLLASDYQTFPNEEIQNEVSPKGSFGIFMNMLFLKVYIPVYLTDPASGDTHLIGKDNYKDRLLFTFDIPINIRMF